MQESNLLPREVPLACRRTHNFLNKPHGSAATQSQALLCGGAGRERCAAQGHTSVTRPNAHSCYISRMQTSSVYINCDVRLLSLQFSPLWPTCTRRQCQHFFPSLPRSHPPPCSQPRQPNAHSRNDLTACFKETEMHLLVPATGGNCNTQTALIQQLIYFSLTLSCEQVSPRYYSSFSHLKFFVPSPCLEYTPHPSQIPACNPNCCNTNSDKCAAVKCKVQRAAKQNPWINNFYFCIHAA